MNKVTDKKATPATPATPVQDAVQVAMAIPVLPTARIGTGGSVSRSQVQSVYGATVADLFNAKGRDFIGYRTSPGAVDADRQVCGQVMGLLKAGKLELEPALQSEVMRYAFKGGDVNANVTGATVQPVEIAILLMGRHVTGSKKAGYNEKGKISDELATWMLHNVCTTVGMDSIYMPHSKARKFNALKTLVDTSK